jgi:transposase-like protein
LQQDASVGEIAQAIGLQPRQTRVWLEHMQRDGTVTVRGGRAATDPKPPIPARTVNQALQLALR